MDGHKLMWHLDRVRAWMAGKKIAPIHIDAGLSKGCNIRCEYCYGVTQGNFFKKGAEIYFAREPLLRYMRDAGKSGVRSIGLIGEGEPLMNPHVYEAIVEGSRAGIDMGMGTNGTRFEMTRTGEQALRHLVWIRFNISAASHAAYLRIHRSELFEDAVARIDFCVRTKRRYKLPITVGLQMVLTPRNVDQVVPLARLGKKLGVDYLVVKQCGDTLQNTLGVYKRLGEYEGYTALLKQAEALSTPAYNVIVKWQKITNKGKKCFDRCLGVPFLIYTSGDGKVYPCGMFFDFKSDEYCMGDLYKSSFSTIIKSKRYWDVVAKVSRIDVHTHCYANCRTHYINDFVWKLKHPPAHVNFI
jgi:MoaA/NifB/PqqE/SkfB family radical SAM enzyme